MQAYTASLKTVPRQSAETSTCIIHDYRKVNMADGDYPQKDGHFEDTLDVQGVTHEGEDPPDYETVLSMPDYQDLPPPPVYEPPTLEGVSPPAPGKHAIVVHVVICMDLKVLYYYFNRPT